MNDPLLGTPTEWDHIAWYTKASDLVGRRPGESLQHAAQRAVRRAGVRPQTRVAAHIILDSRAKRGDAAWLEIARAVRVGSATSCA